MIADKKLNYVVCTNWCSWLALDAMDMNELVNTVIRIVLVTELVSVGPQVIEGLAVILTRQQSDK